MDTTNGWPTVTVSGITLNVTRPTLSADACARADADVAPSRIRTAATCRTSATLPRAGTGTPEERQQRLNDPAIRLQ